MKRSSVLHNDAAALSSGHKGEPPSTLGRRRLRRVLFATAALAVVAAASFGQTTAAPGQTDKVHGFPWWYQDQNSSTRLEPCLDTHSGGCVLLQDRGFDPKKVVSFPGNFPSEFFYYVVDSDKVTTSGCKANTVSPGVPLKDIPQGTAKYRAAVEGSFVNGVVQPGQQITFGRTKIVASGLCPNTDYTFRHPYGTDTITTNELGQVVANKKGGTIDVGCAAAPCTWTDTNQSRVLTAFLRPPKPPTGSTTGYLGDAVSLSSVSGSPVGQNFFSVSGLNNNNGTDKFTVSGRIAGPVMLTPYAADFGVAVKGSTVQRALTVTNISTGSVSLSALESGANPRDFNVPPPNGCPSLLDKGLSCTINLNFKPTTTSGESAQIQLGRAVDESGTGSSANSSFALSPTNIDFGPMRVRGTSDPQAVTVKNTSTSAPLQVTSAALAAGGDQFGIASDACTGRLVEAGNTCAITVTFNPTIMGSPTTTLAVAAGGSPQSVSLTGTPTGGTSAVASTNTPYGFPDWYEDENQIKLKPCLDTTDPTCVILPDPPNYDPARGMNFDSSNSGINFPSEAFYFVADSDNKVTTPGCPASVVDGVSYLPVAPGKAKYRAAIEQAFLNGPPKWGEQITFTRTKIVASGLCPMTTYYFTHPYGRDVFTTNELGQIVANKKGGTVDVGCGALNCNFSVALGGRVLGGFLQWDPAVPPLAPAGHLGDGNVGTLHTVIGSPFMDPITKGRANFFRIESDIQGTPVPGAFTNLFTVAGAISQ